MNTRARAVNDASTSGSVAPSASTVVLGRRPARGPPDENGRPVADLLYVGLVIAMFAILVLAARGLERL